MTGRPGIGLVESVREHASVTHFPEWKCANRGLKVGLDRRGEAINPNLSKNEICNDNMSCQPAAEVVEIKTFDDLIDHSLNPRAIVLEDRLSSNIQSPGRSNWNPCRATHNMFKKRWSLTNTSDDLPFHESFTLLTSWTCGGDKPAEIFVA
ncbi:MAG: hypothetical protein ACREVK_01380 [Gammaproteobacteria bacterium]